MDEAKRPWRSLTVIAAAASLIVSVAGALGIVLDAATVGQAIDAGSQIVSAVMAGIAINGRLRATTRIARG